MITVGIDIGTSSVKVALVGDDDHVIATASRALDREPPAPRLQRAGPGALVEGRRGVPGRASWQRTAPISPTPQAIGLSGQMHGATLLDEKGDVLRPCILWNDGRSAEQCEQLTRDWPALHAVTGNLAMPGFTAPKLMWVREHEPAIFARVAKVLLPKAYVRYRLCGEPTSKRCPMPRARCGSTWASANGPTRRSRPRECGATRCRAWWKAMRSPAS